MLCKIKDICMAWMLSHCKHNAIHCKINDICIAWMVKHCKNNVIHNKINDIRIVWMLNHCKNNVIHWSECFFLTNPTFRVDKTLDSPTTEETNTKSIVFYNENRVFNNSHTQNVRYLS